MIIFLLEKRLNTLTHRLEYYVHYENLDRRLDEWIDGEFDGWFLPEIETLIFSGEARARNSRFKRVLVEQSARGVDGYEE